MNKLKILFICLILVSYSASIEAEIKPTAQKHIRERHWYHSNQGSGQQNSHFNQSMGMEKLNILAMKTIKNGSVGLSKHGNGRKVYQHTFKKPIGWKSKGVRAYSMRVVTERDGTIITAFPV